MVMMPYTGTDRCSLIVAYVLWSMFCLGEENSTAFRSLVRAVGLKWNDKGQATGPAALGLPIHTKVPSGFPLVQLPIARYLSVEE